jgi:hypothetical protein
LPESKSEWNRTKDKVLKEAALISLLLGNKGVCIVSKIHFKTLCNLLILICNLSKSEYCLPVRKGERINYQQKPRNWGELAPVSQEAGRILFCSEGTISIGPQLVFNLSPGRRNTNNVKADLAWVRILSSVSRTESSPEETTTQFGIL